MGFVIGVGSMADIIIRSGRAANWWDPNNAGLSIAGAYRAINSVGTPWPGGPVNYAQSLVNQANPGVNDLVEGNGAVPWVQATGWGFVAAALQWLDTGLIPVNDQSWTGICQYANATDAFAMLFGCDVGAFPFFLIQPHNSGSGGVRYFNGNVITVGPILPSGNVAVAGNRGYRNGLVEGPPIAAAGAAFTRTIYIGGDNRNGVFDFEITADIYALAIYDGGAAAVQAEVAAIAAAMLVL